MTFHSYAYIFGGYFLFVASDISFLIIRITTFCECLPCAGHGCQCFIVKHLIITTALQRICSYYPLDTWPIETETLGSLSELTWPGSGRDGISVRQFWLWGPLTACCLSLQYICVSGTDTKYALTIDSLKVTKAC